MLASHFGIEQLKHKLALRLDVKISQNMDAMLRFFDPRILEQLVRVLTSEQLMMLCGPAVTWWYVDRMGMIVRIENQFHEVVSVYKLELSEDQEYLLLSLSQPDQVAHLLRKTMPQIEAISLETSYQIIADSIRAANKLKLDAISDLALYSAMWILRGPHFEELPYWREVLPEVRSSKISFANAVANSEDIVWEA